MLRKTIKATELVQKDGEYELVVDKKLVEQYQIAGQETEIKVIAKTADNRIRSREAISRSSTKK
jgi:hypothetical protein